MAEGKRVLVLGAGLVTGPLVQYLSDHGFKVTVASRTLSKAQELCVNAPNATALALDVEKPEDMERLEGLTQDADAVISMLPYLFHVQAAKLAIKHKKHFLTTSYVSDAMQELDQAARDAGIAMINECGVDPGTDHMSAMRVIDDVRRRGGKIVSFTSLCGGLPMPIDNNNPLGYKFSWAPRGVLLASLNKARFLKDGEILEWDSDKVFSGEHLVHIDELGLDLEMYPNRNSLPYKDVYQIDSAQTILRGTFRYPGWSQTILSLIRLGWLNLEDSPDLAGKSYRQVTLELLSKDGRDGLHEGEDVRAGVARVLALDASIEKKILDNFEFLGLFSEEQKIPAGTRTRLDGICSAMLGKEEMEYKPNERDMIVMQHKYVAEFPAEEGKKENITTTLISYGLPGGFSAMARTVTYPVAIATRLLLEGKIEQRGIIRPTTPELYNPILDELENSFGIKFVDVYQ